MLVDFAESMSFCRECGKKVQDDWVTVRIVRVP